MSTRVSFGRDDVAIVDWSAALLVDREPDDVRSVLEFANSSCSRSASSTPLSTGALDRSYEVVSKPRRFGALAVGCRAASRRDRQLRGRGRDPVRARRQRDQAGRRSYLARVYRAASQRFRLAEWNAGILRKLETIESLYRKVQDRASGARAEALEWIIIALMRSRSCSRSPGAARGLIASLIPARMNQPTGSGRRSRTHLPTSA